MTNVRQSDLSLPDIQGSGLLPGSGARFATIFEIDCDSAFEAAPRLEQTLDARERAEVKRLQHPLRRRRSVVLRGALRAVLGVQLQLPPERVPLFRTSYGQPRLECQPFGCRLGFSCASRDGHGAIAVASSEAVGIDLERITRERFPDHLAAHMLHERELTLFAALPIHARPAWLATAWTTKEAVLKAIGCGLSVDPRTLVAMSPDSSDCLDIEEPHLQQSVVHFDSWRYRRGDMAVAFAFRQAGVTPRRVRLALRFNKTSA